VVDLFADHVTLELHPTIDEPVDPECDHLVRNRENRFRAWISERLIDTGHAAELNPIVAPDDLDGSRPAAWDSALSWFHRPIFFLAGQNPSARRIPGFVPRLRQILPAESLTESIVTDPRVFRSRRVRSFVPVEFAFDARAAPSDEHRRKICV